MTLPVVNSFEVGRALPRGALLSEARPRGPSRRRCTDPAWAVFGVLAFVAHAAFCFSWLLSPPTGRGLVDESKTLLGSHFPPQFASDLPAEDTSAEFTAEHFVRSSMGLFGFAGVVAVLSPFCSFGVVAGAATIGSWLFPEAVGMGVGKRRQLAYFAWALLGLLPFGLGSMWVDYGACMKLVLLILVPVFALIRLVTPGFCRNPTLGVGAHFAAILNAYSKMFQGVAGTGYFLPPISIPFFLAAFVITFLLLPSTVLSFMVVDVLYEVGDWPTTFMALASLGSGCFLGKFSCDLSFWASSWLTCAAPGACPGLAGALCALAKGSGTVLRGSVSEVFTGPLTAAGRRCGIALLSRPAYSGLEHQLLRVQSALNGSDYAGSSHAARMLRDVLEGPALDHSAFVSATVLLGGCVGCLLGMCGQSAPWQYAATGCWVGGVMSGALAGAFGASELVSQTIAVPVTGEQGGVIEGANPVECASDGGKAEDAA